MSTAAIRSGRVWIALTAGPLLAVVVYALVPDGFTDADGATVTLGHAGRATAGVAAWMATWWMTEAIHVSATALLPIALLPALDAMPLGATTARYGHPLIFLFMGGFMLALTMERWGLHRRIALTTLRVVGTRPRRMIGGFMLVTATLSMWVSNSATTAMMLPIAVSVSELAAGDEDHRARFATCMLLGIAYAASIGGIGTIIGTPPNGFLVSFADERLGHSIGFVEWMGVGVPLVALFLPLAWLVLTRRLYHLDDAPVEGGAEVINRQLRELGRLSTGEWVTLAVFLLAAAAWISRPLLDIDGLTDTGIAIAAGLLLFVIPVDIEKREFALDWATARRLPWGTLVLFGGGLSIAAAIDGTGLGAYLGTLVSGLEGAPTILLIAAIATLVIFLTELTSNTATTTAFVPILAGVAPGLGADPLALALPATLAASCAFMLPVATPPNAIVFGSGKVTIPQMMRAGIWLNLIGIVVVTAIAYAVAIPLLTG